jgi:hypothetical protein
MGVTRLKRKGRRNKQTAKARVAKIKSLSFQPVLKNVDAEELKASFVKEAPKKEEKAAKAEAKPKAEKKEVTPKAETKTAKPKAEKKAAAPKAEKKEAKPKAEKVAEEKKVVKKAPAKKKATKEEE